VHHLKERTALVTTGAYALSPIREAVSTKERQRFPEKTQRKTVRYPVHHLKELKALVTTGAYALSPLREAVSTKKRQRFPEKTQRKTVRYPAHHLKELTARVTTGAYALSPLREAVNNYTSWDTILTVPLVPFYPIDVTRGSQRHTHELPNVLWSS
jgi:hypothetical protein